MEINNLQVHAELTKQFDGCQNTLIKKILTATGSMGVPQGGLCSPLAANIDLNNLDWPCERWRQETEDGPYDALNDARFADDLMEPARSGGISAPAGGSGGVISTSMVFWGCIGAGNVPWTGS
jgi:hypothetical protein